MFTIVRRSLLALSLIGLVAACGSAGPSTSTPAATASSARPSGASATSSPTASPTPSSAATPYPADLAPITGTFTATACCHMTLTLTTNDPRVSGTATFDLSYRESEDGRSAWEWGTLDLSNDGGSWDGSCRGGGWANGARAEVSCWLAGRDGYDGLTYFQHLSSNRAQGGHLYGLILPVAAPTV
jgi:hypothetical protein